MKYPPWKCPHCGHRSGTMVFSHDRFDYMFEDPNHMKELWQCSECDGWFFAYFKLYKITAVQEVELKSEHIQTSDQE